MGKVRIIMQSNDSGTHEYVRFETDDMKSPVDDFKMPECNSIQESITDDLDFPSGFPFNHNLRRD